MPTTVSKFMIPRAIKSPRGAAWAAAFAATLTVGLAALAALGRGASHPVQRAGAALWRALEASGEARARRDLLEMADRRQSDAPGLAHDLREAAAFLRSTPRAAAATPRRCDAEGEAAAVREFAYRLMKADPRFAAELFAAADRHETQAHRS
jgi:hypothetical protein